MDSNQSDSEDDDLEALRLAALATLKPRTENKPASPEPGPSAQFLPFPRKEPPPVNQNQFAWKNSPAANRRGRGRGGFPKIMNQRSNLIVITPVSEENEAQEEKKAPAPQLLLPQHKWCQPANESSSSPKTFDRRGPTRFNRHGSGSDSSDSDLDDEVRDQDSYSNETILQDENSMNFPEDSEGTPTSEKNDRIDLQMEEDNAAVNDAANYSGYQYNTLHNQTYGIYPDPSVNGEITDYHRRLSTDGSVVSGSVDPNDLRTELKKRMLKLRADSVDASKSETTANKHSQDERRSSGDFSKECSRDVPRSYDRHTPENAEQGSSHNRSRSRSRNRSVSRSPGKFHSRSPTYTRNGSRSPNHTRNKSRSPSSRDTDRAGSWGRDRNRTGRNSRRETSDSPGRRRRKRSTPSPDRRNKSSWSRSPVKSQRKRSVSSNRSKEPYHSSSPDKNNKQGFSRSPKVRNHSPEGSKTRNCSKSPERRKSSLSKSPEKSKIRHSRKHNYSRTPERNRTQGNSRSPNRSSNRYRNHSPRRSKSPNKSHKHISPPSSRANKSSRSPRKGRRRSFSRSPDRLAKRSRTQNPSRNSRTDNTHKRSRSRSPDQSSRSDHRRSKSRSPAQTFSRRSRSPVRTSRLENARRSRSPCQASKLDHARSPEKLALSHRTSLERKLSQSKSPPRNHSRDSSESSDCSDRGWNRRKDRDRWSRSPSSSKSSADDHRPVKSVLSVIKPVQSSVVGSKDDNGPFGSNVSGSPVVKENEEKPKVLLSLVKSSIVVGDSRNNAADMGKRLPVHMRLGPLSRNKPIKMAKDVEAAFFNSSSDDDTVVDGKKTSSNKVAADKNVVRRAEDSVVDSKSRRKRSYR